jgi:hypothetical protein
MIDRSRWFNYLATRADAWRAAGSGVGIANKFLDDDADRKNRRR